MGNIIFFSWITIVMLFFIVSISILVIRNDLKKRKEIGALVALNFLIYCLLQYSCGFIHWTIRWDKFDNYPYKNPFCILVIIYCTISFIISGTYYIRYEKNKYGLKKAFLFLIMIHLLALLLIMFFSPFNNWF